METQPLSTKTSQKTSAHVISYDHSNEDSDLAIHNCTEFDCYETVKEATFECRVIIAEFFSVDFLFSALL